MVETSLLYPGQKWVKFGMSPRLVTKKNVTNDSFDISIWNELLTFVSAFPTRKRTQDINRKKSYQLNSFGTNYYLIKS